MPIGRILYVEDNLENRILIKRVLEAEGYVVEEAPDGLTSIDMAVTNPPDLILMDINLPDIDGYEATTRLRRSASTAHVPIVALTANVMQGDRERSLQAGCDGYIPKPIDVDHLPAQIASYLGNSDGRPKAIGVKR
jgi:two-component system cell cycle response regulator DivK